MISEKTSSKTIIAGDLRKCTHVAGVINFLHLSEQVGWRTVFLGPAVSVNQIIETTRREKADMVGVSYRLTPENSERLLGEFAEAAEDINSKVVRFVFGGTPPEKPPMDKRINTMTSSQSIKGRFILFSP